MNTLTWDVIFDAHEHNDDPKSLQSITARKAARLAWDIEMYEGMIQELPLFVDLTKRNADKRYFSMVVTYQKKLLARYQLLASYNDLVSDEGVRVACEAGKLMANIAIRVYGEEQ